MRKYKIGICQMDSQNDKADNLRAAGELIATAARKETKVVVLPETFNFMGRGYKAQAEAIPGSTSDFLCEQAKANNIWIVGGSFPETDKSGKPKNTMLLIDTTGRIRAKYSKLHMFDADMQGGTSVNESAHNTAGNEIVLADTELGRFGFAICYDLRFGELFRMMALQGAQVIYVPSCFAAESGKYHWETLLRTRAIENSVYIVAPNQNGQKTNMKAYGHSMVIDPWGSVIAEITEGTGFAVAEIDLDYVESVKKQIPALAGRREDVYQLFSNQIRIY